MKTYGNCSKNYINCRKHPTRTTSAAKRTNEDFKTFRLNVTKEQVEAKRKLDEALAEPGAKQATLKRLTAELSEVETQVHATESKARFDAWVKSQKDDISKAKAEGKSTLTLERNLAKSIKARETVISDIKLNVDKEMALEAAKTSPLQPFQNTVASLIVQEGDAYTGNPEDTWGDSRGQHVFSASEHLKNDCEVAILNNYNEQYNWETSDSFSSLAETGISAHLSCKCGEVYDQLFIVEKGSFGSMFERLMNYSPPKKP